MSSQRNNPKSHLVSTEDVLQKFLMEGKSPLAHGFKRWKLWKNWEKVVGKTISKNSTPVDYNKGTLFVWVKHPVVLQDLIFIREDIKNKINTYMRDTWVKRISFTTDRKSVPDVKNASDQFKKTISKF